MTAPDVVGRRRDEGAVLGEIAGLEARRLRLAVVDADVEHDDDEDENDVGHEPGAFFRTTYYIVPRLK